MTGTGPSDDRPAGGDAALAAEYVLGLMSDADVAEFEMRLATEEPLVEHVVAWTEYFALLAEAVPDAAPPARAKRRIEAAAFGDAPRAGFWRALLPVGIGGLVVAGLAWAALTFGVFGTGGPRPELVADIAVEDRALAIHAGWFDESAELLVIREAGEVPGGSDLELWVIAGEGPPVSLGLVPQDSDRIRYTLTPAVAGLLPGATLALSQEPPGGSPTGAPTGPVLGTAPITVY